MKLKYHSCCRRAGAVGLALTAVLLPSLLAQQPLPFAASFEAQQGYVPGSVAGQQGWRVDQGEAAIEVGEGRNDSNGLVIAPTDPFGQVSVIFDKDLQHDIAFTDFWMMPAATEAEPGREFLDQEGAISGFFRIDEEGEFYVLDGNGERGGEWISTGVKMPLAENGAGPWTRITLRQDFRAQAKVWDIFINGELRAADLGFWDEGSDWLERFSLMGHTKIPLHVDDVSIGASNPLFTDENRDGLSDERAALWGGASEREADADGDGLSNLQEAIAGTDAAKVDSDGNGIHDGFDTGMVAVGESDLMDLHVAALPLFTEGEGSAAERLEMLRGLSRQKQRGVRGTPEDLLEAAKKSPAYELWAEANGAHFEFQASQFSRAEARYEKIAQRLLNARGDSLDERFFINQAKTNLGQQYALLGKVSELGALLSTMNLSELSGSPARAYRRLLQAHGNMSANPTRAYRCGLSALMVMRKSLGIVETDEEKLAAEAALVNGLQSIPGRGLSLAMVKRLADDLGVRTQTVRRPLGAEVPVPSVVHWKIGHFATVVGRAGEDYVVKDAALARRWIVSKAILDEEASGHFLVPSDRVPAGWEQTRTAETNDVWGKTTPCWAQDERNQDCPEDCSKNLKMPGYSFSRYSANLVITDTPAYYKSPNGSIEGPTLTYMQDSASVLGDPTYSALPNLGAGWALSGISYALKPNGDPDVTVILPDGRKETFERDSASDPFDTNPQSLATLEEYDPPVGVGYQRTSTDGTVMTFLFTKTIGTNHIYMLDQIDYPNDYSLDYSYSGSTNIYLDDVKDSFGREVTFGYVTGSRRINKITVKGSTTDKVATITYDGSNRLDSITDAEGMVTNFEYDGSSDFIDEMETPYSRKDGTPYKPTKFTRDTASHGTGLMIEDPEGLKEVVVYDGGSYGVGDLPGVTSSGTADAIEKPNIFQAEGYVNDYQLDEGLSLHWTKNAVHHMEEEEILTVDSIDDVLSHADYAHQTHWLRLDISGGDDLVTPVVASTRSPLTFRVWYRYPGQSQTYYAGTSNLPSHVVTLVRDKTILPSVTSPTSSQMDARLHKYTYNSEGNVTWEKDPEGRQTEYDYHSNGIDLHKVKQYNGSSYETVARYETYTDHLPKYIYDAGDNKTTLEYKSGGRISKITNPDNEVTTYTYSSTHDYLTKVERTNPGGSPSTVTLYEVTAFDNFWRPATVEDADGYELDYTYDDLDRVTEITHPDGTDEDFSYEVGTTMYVELQKYTDREGKNTVYEYNKNRQLTNVDDPEHTNDTIYDWCACGDLKKLTDPDGNITTWTRDMLGRVTEKKYDDGEKFTYYYEPESGQLSTVTNPVDQGTSNHTYAQFYWPDGNLYKMDYTDSTGVDSTFTYDDDYDRLTQRVDAGSGYSYTTSYSYHPVNGTTDGGGELSVINGPWSYDEIRYTYDNQGRVKKRVIDNSDAAQEHTMEWVFDELGRVEDVITGIGTFSNTFVNASGLIDEIDYPNGQTADYIYHTHGDGRYLKQIKNFKVNSSTSTLSDFTYTYTDSGRIDRWYQKRPNNSSASSSSPRNFDHTYDDVYQLDTVTEKNIFLTTLNTWNFDYDAAGSRTKKTYNTSVTNYTPNDRNQITAISGAPGSYTLSYDDDGNLTSKAKSGGGTVNYEWDATGNLTAIEVLAGSSPATGDTRTEIRYNGMGQRMEMFEKVRSGSSWVLDTTLGSLNHLYFVWCDGQLCQRRTGSSSTTTKTNFYPMGESRHTASGSGNKTDFFYNLDHLGSVHEMTNSSGSIVAAYRYTSYGVREEQSFSTDVCEIGFTGHHYHERTGLHLTWFRAYDADLGRWISPDPLGEGGDGTNIYSYILNDSVNGLDPDGLRRRGPRVSPRQQATRLRHQMRRKREQKRYNDYRKRTENRRCQQNLATRRAINREIQAAQNPNSFNARGNGGSDQMYTPAQAMQIANGFLGPGFTVTRSGMLQSANGRRVVRPASQKPRNKGMSRQCQMNLVRKDGQGNEISNYHINVWTGPTMGY